MAQLTLLQTANEYHTEWIHFWPDEKTHDTGKRRLDQGPWSGWV